MISSSLILPLFVLLSSATPNDGVVRETVAMVELNHFYDDLGRHAYDQVIFYEWSEEYCRYHVIAWCLVEDDQSRLPTRIGWSRVSCALVRSRYQTAP